ncbi:MAG: hypothetical protein HSCHL_1046 [Hydrogenibacillus schlegelii]|uniref:Uncharacterized protein n=1 Tax=Hydrogenibacillus schlegelii TaxID=1484 RepID=A0A2T5G6N9_HYDSH|nr:MAG: hypothetical protein HSCHL_1046 [Hydrogenibacillus schlegelii]
MHPDKTEPTADAPPGAGKRHKENESKMPGMKKIVLTAVCLSI